MMIPLNLCQLEKEPLMEHAAWWGARLREAALKLKQGSVQDYRQNIVSVLGLLHLYADYIDELKARNLLNLGCDNDDDDFFLSARDFALETIETMEDWLYGTERLRIPARFNPKEKEENV